MTMDRAIFNLNVSVEATSLYILLCALNDEGTPVTLKAAKGRWNSEENALHGAARELMGQGVLQSSELPDEETLLYINTRESWKLP